MDMNYKIGGCDVPFPHQAYGVQMSFMGKVISALEHGQNALLEAPTGSGKTLSLLCSSLAWQRREKARIEQAQAIKREMIAPHAGFGAVTEDTPVQGVKCEDSSPDPNFRIRLPDSSSPKTEGDAVSTGGEAHPSGSDVKPPTTATTAATATTATATPPPSLGDGGFIPADHSSAEDLMAGEPIRARPPKIYYVTRTHSQIAQVVRELKRSGHHPRMAVLAAKQHYCINSFARDQPSLEEACDDLLKNNDCTYFKGIQAQLNSDAAWKIHDIEDLSKLGKKRKACPYFLSRKWAADAELIFGPYSYIVDPVIRRSMGIELDDAIVIFDEAHNIEDVSREAASLELERMTVMEMQMSFTRAAQYNNKPDIYQPLADLGASVLKWMTAKEVAAAESISRARPGNGRAGASRFEPYERIWQGAPLMAELFELGLGPDTIDPLWDAYQAAREEEENMQQSTGKEKENGPPRDPAAPAGSSLKAVRVGGPALGTASRLIQIVRLLHQVSTDGGRDYRLVVHRVHHQAARQGGGGGGSRPRVILGVDLPPPPEYLLTMHLWCLNPAVAFGQVAAPAHSIILTSGTLAPLDSFASELGVAFDVRLEAPHVINMQRQVWAGVIPWGPSGTPLLATFQHTNTPEFQDALGATVIAACRTIPDGVLLFLPSYSLLDKLAGRWKVTGVWSRLAQLKHVVTEPRGGGPDALQMVITEYYDAIKEGKGGLFMAVCRGKVSEGIDFADGNARGVLVVGIPFPNVKDSKVDAKRRFNDVGAKTLGLLPGNIWYEQQAFRALNQAIGRCIRHRGDWGAILLVDERFRSPKYQKGLSRWVRSAVTALPNFDATTASMQQFFATLKANPPAMPARPAIEDVIVEPDAPVDAIAMLMAGRKVAKATLKAEREPLPAQPPPPPSAATIPSAQGIVAPPHQVNIKHEAAPHAHQQQQQQQHPALAAAPIGAWVATELTSWSRFVVQQGAAMTEFDARNLATMGILDAFAMARDALSSGPQCYHQWMTTLLVEPPRGVQAVLAAAGGGGLPPRVVLDPGAAQYGMQHMRGWPPPQLLDAMEGAYRQELGAYAQSPPTVLPQQQQQIQQQQQVHPADDAHKRKWGPSGVDDPVGAVGPPQTRVLQSERAEAAAATGHAQQQVVQSAAEARQAAIAEALGGQVSDSDSDFK